MRKKIIGAYLFLAMLVVGVVLASGPASADNHKPNHPGYWENEYPGATCYKNSHGTVTNNGKAVTLPEFNPDWPGDRWEVLIVKGGNGYHEYPLPDANTPYGAPVNNGGNQADVSHWIVCKGTAPEPIPTPTPTATPEPTPDPDPSPVVETGEAFTVVAGCEGDEWVTRTTVTPWSETDGERTYGEPVTTETRTYDPGCVDGSEPKPEPEPETPVKAKPATPVVAEATFTG